MVKRLFLTLILTFFFALPAWSSNSLTYENINGQELYGYWVNAGGKKYFVVCDQDGEPVKTEDGKGVAWINNGKYVFQESKVFDGYEFGPDFSQPKHKLYSVEPPGLGPQWKGQINLNPYWSDQQKVKITSPYGNKLPEHWRWLVFKIQNINPWPVTSEIYTAVDGATFSDEKYFKEYETKQFLFKLNDKVPVDTGKLFITTKIKKNHDPVAPAEPTDYINNPPADDGTGTVWASRFYQGLVIDDKPDLNWSRGIWGLVPCFKEVPVWIPDSGEDPRWGKLSFDVVPAYRWTIVGHITPVRAGGNYISVERLQSGMPRFIEGTIGAYTKNQNDIPKGAPVIGPYIKYTIKASNQTIDAGMIKPDQTPSAFPNSNTWHDIPVDNQPHQIIQYNKPYEIIKDGPYYAPIYGSYVEITNIERLGNGSPDRTYCRYNIQIFNPLDSPITFELNGGWWNDGYKPLKLPAADQGTITIAPHQAAWFTGNYVLSNKSSMGAIPPEWKNNHISFEVGSIAPMETLSYMFEWQASNIKNNAVAYDYGAVMAPGDTVIFLGPSDVQPGFNGNLIEYEQTMTPIELVTFINNHFSSTGINKIIEVMNSGITNWKLKATVHYKNGNYYSVTSMEGC